MTVEEALKLCERIDTMIYDEIAPAVYNKAPDFFDSVEERSDAIRETIERNNNVTQAQAAALENIAEAIGKWIHD